MERRGGAGPGSFKKGMTRGQSPIPGGSGTMDLSELLGVDISTISMNMDSGIGLNMSGGGSH